MRRPVFKQVWLRDVDASPLGDTERLSALKEGLGVSYLCSRAKNPRLLSTCIIGLSLEEAERANRRVLAGKRAKNKIKEQQHQAAERETLWKVKIAERERELDELREEMLKLTEALARTEEQRDRAQKNVEILSRNLNDPSITEFPEGNKSNRVSGGLATLSEMGGHGPPLRGGLPGLGKRR